MLYSVGAPEEEPDFFLFLNTHVVDVELAVNMQKLSCYEKKKKIYECVQHPQHAYSLFGSHVCIIHCKLDGVSKTIVAGIKGDNFSLCSSCSWAFHYNYGVTN